MTEYVNEWVPIDPNDESSNSLSQTQGRGNGVSGQDQQLADNSTSISNRNATVASVPKKLVNAKDGKKQSSMMSFFIKK